MKRHSTEYSNYIVARDGMALTRCGRFVKPSDTVIGKDTRRVTCLRCRSIKKARTP